MSDPEQPCCEHPLDGHDPDEGCLHGWTAAEKGCPCRPAGAETGTRPAGVFDRIAVGMLLAGADIRFRPVAGQHDRRRRRNR